MPNGEKFAQSYLGYGGFAKQTAIGTYVTPTSFFCYNSANLKEQYDGGREVYTCISASPNYKKMSIGRTSLAGDIAVPITPDEFEKLLALILGNNNSVTGGATTGYTHVFEEPTELKPLAQNGASFTFHLGGESGTSTVTVLDFLGVYFSKASLTFPVSGVATASFSCVGRNEAVQSALLTPSYSTVQAYEGWMAKLQIGDTLATVADYETHADITFDIDRKMTMMPAMNGTRFPVGKTVDRADIMVNFGKMVEADLGLYNMFKAGTYKAVKLIVTHPTLAGSSSGVYSLTFEFPKVGWKEGTPEIDSGTVTVNQPGQIQALEGDTEGYAMKVTAVNSTAGVYAV